MLACSDPVAPSLGCCTVADNHISAAEINRIEKRLNNRPRKCLNYKMPYEMFTLARGALEG